MARKKFIVDVEISVSLFRSLYPESPFTHRKVVEMSKRTKEHAFSIELKSKEHVRHFAMPNDAKDEVLIEGFLGELEGSSFDEGVMLELRGTNGVLRMDLTEDELRKLLQQGSSAKGDSMEAAE